MKDRITIYNTDEPAPGTRFIYRRLTFGRDPIVLQPGQAWIEGEIDEGSHYIDVATGAPVAKQPMALTVEMNRISGIPEGTSAIVNLERQAETIDDGDIDFDVDHPQTVHVTLENPYWLPWQGEVTCEPD